MKYRRQPAGTNRRCPKSQLDRKPEAVSPHLFHIFNHRTPKEIWEFFFCRFLDQSKMRVPPEIREIIWEYIHEMNMIRSLPSKRAVKQLIKKSNVDILKRFLNVQLHLDAGSLPMNPFLFRRSVLNNPIQLSILTDVTITSLRLYSATGILKWLFLDQDLYLYPGYFTLLQTSVLFDVISNVDFDLIAII